MTQELGEVSAARRDAARTTAAEMLEQTGGAGAAGCQLGRAREAAVVAAVVALGGTPGCWKEDVAEGGIQVCGDGRVEEGLMADCREGTFLGKREAAALEEEAEDPLVGLGSFPL